MKRFRPSPANLAMCASGKVAALVRRRPSGDTTKACLRLAASSGWAASSAESCAGLFAVSGTKIAASTLKLSNTAPDAIDEDTVLCQ